MSRIKFELNRPGLTELMKSPEMLSVLNGAAAQISSAAGDGYEAESAHPISFVGIASVRAATPEARRDNNRNNTLDKALGGAHI